MNWYPGVNWSTTSIEFELYYSFIIYSSTTSGILPVNAHVEVNILNLNYIYSFIFYSSKNRFSNDIHYN